MGKHDNQPVHCKITKSAVKVQKQGTADSGSHKRTQSAGVTQWIRQQHWRSWMGDVLVWDPSSNYVLLMLKWLVQFGWRGEVGSDSRSSPRFFYEWDFPFMF